MKTGTQSDVAFVRVPVRVACPTRRDVLLAESIQYRGTPLHSAVPKKFFCGTSKRRGPRPLESNTSSIFSSPNNRGGTEQSCDIYIYISCRLERIYLSQFGRPQPPKVPVLSVGVRDELFGKFLRFF